MSLGICPTNNLTASSSLLAVEMVGGLVGSATGGAASAAASVVLDMLLLLLGVALRLRLSCVCAFRPCTTSSSCARAGGAV